MKSIIGLQLLIAFYLKGNMDKLWILVSNLQVIVYMPLYRVTFPANLDIYLK